MELIVALLLFFVVIPLCVAIGVRNSVYRKAEQGELPEQRRRSSTSRSTGAGRAAMKGYRAYGDAKAIARGTYGKRLARRMVFRGIRKL